MRNVYAVGGAVSWLVPMDCAGVRWARPSHVSSIVPTATVALSGTSGNDCTWRVSAWEEGCVAGCVGLGRSDGVSGIVRPTVVVQVQSSLKGTVLSLCSWYDR